jgi:hypothetical protein
MKLVFKPIDGAYRGLNGFALHTEAGEMLPSQAQTKLITRVDRPAIIRVDFVVNDEIAVEGTE